MDMTLFTSWARVYKTYVWGVGAAPEESVSNLLCVVSGDETNRR
jgi:hypothetical protein